MKDFIKNFTLGEKILWLMSALCITAAFMIFDRGNFLTLIASLFGVTAILLNAKGNPLGQMLMIFFSVMYGVISYKFAYYGEMITYLGMTGPMAVLALVSWLRHPFENNKSEVEVNHIKKGELGFMWFLAAAVTVLFYFILRHFNTANLFFSTVSVTTSFVAVYLTFRRSELFSLGYAANDIILIILWSLASIQSREYICMVICFIAFLANDTYAYFSWLNIKKCQMSITASVTEK